MNLETYIEELKKDVIVNEFNLKEKALALPGLKAKWVSRLINHTNNLAKIQKSKKDAIRDAIPHIKSNMPVKLTDSFLKEKLEDDGSIKSIQDQITNEEQIVNFLERTEKIMSSMTYDLGNIVKVIQLETL